MSPRSEQSFTAYVGIDWADTKHDICVQVAGDTRRQLGVRTKCDRWFYHYLGFDVPACVYARTCLS